jgi:hypothetical protein
MQRSSFDFDVITGPAARPPSTPQPVSWKPVTSGPAPTPKPDPAKTEPREETLS